MSKFELNPVEKAFRNSLEAHFSAYPKLVVGVSGGADSMALLFLIKKTGLNALVIHINYGLRGKESDLDQELVEGLSFEWGFDCVSARLNTEDSKKENFQKWARDQRYQIFRDLYEQNNADAIIVAHHQDDQVETILQKLLRGSGVSSWQGMKEWDGEIWRPLLDISKEQILDYCQSENIPYRTDSSNLSSDYARNFIRNDLAQRFDDFFPGWKQNLLGLSGLGKVTQQAVEELTKTISSKNEISAGELNKLPTELRKAMLKEFLIHQGIQQSSKGELEELDTLIIGETGKKVILSDEKYVVKDRESLVFVTKGKVEGNFTFNSNESFSDIDHPILGFKIADSSFKKEGLYMATDSFKWPVTLRRWKAGDKIVPFGMNGSQTVAGHLTNRKVSSAKKEKALVLCGSDGTIYAIIFPEPGKSREIGTISEQVKLLEETKRTLTIYFK